MQEAVDRLSQGFASPPNGARPRVWWHWMNGNITEEGIRRDLEWMKRVGVGGLQNFDAQLATPQVVEERLSYMTPPWRKAFRFAAGLADELGLELAIASSPGWSETGGPWVKPPDGIKKYVWSETIVEGGRAVVEPLLKPPSRTGPFQDAPVARDALAAASDRPTPEFYADTLVVAFPTPDDGQADWTFSASGEIDPVLLGDGQLTTFVQLDPASETAPAWLLAEAPPPRTVSSATLGVIVPGDLRLPAFLEASDDGRAFRTIAEIPTGRIPQHTISFPPVTARAFRVRFEPFIPAEGLARLGGVPGAAPFSFGRSSNRTIRITRFALHGAARVHRFEHKAGFGLVADYYALATPPDVAARPVDPAEVIDLTGKMGPDGRLDWTAPDVRAWTVLRFGYSLTGKHNHPATAEATGLEVDKLDRAAVENYIETYLDTFAEATGPELIGEHDVRALLNDSIEVGPMNWTGALLGEFRARRGYDFTPWAPVLAGFIVGDAARSDAALYDFRRTIGDLLAEHHYGQIARSVHARGLIHYAEALEDGRPSLGDDMAMRRHADVPMGAMWTYAPARGPRPSYVADLRGAASVAHVYGQNLVGAESMTAAMSPWAFAPADLKPNVDLQFALGVNRLMIHTSVHQPVEKKPGLSLSVFGQYFNRHDTWAEQAGPWVDYIARSSFLLQQGRFFADVAYFYGEEAPLTGLFADKPIADAPSGHGFDFVNADVVLNHLGVEDGILRTPSGMRYAALYLGGSSRRMTLAVLGKLAQLAADGATLIGERPQGSPSLADDPAEFAALADRLWGERAGAGRVIAGRGVDAALREIGLAPDFDYAKPCPDSELMFVHRQLEGGDLYFVSNRKDRAERVEASFRVTGRRAEIWRAATGSRAPASWRIEGGRTFVTLDLAAHDAVFVLFREPAPAAAETAPEPRLTTLASLDGPWEVSFEPERGAPAGIRLERLVSLSDLEDDAIRHFSGKSTYRAGFDLSPGAAGAAEFWLDLGEVGDVAEVFVNEARVGVSCLAPHRFDVSQAVRPWRNELEIRVFNVWVNRLVGDAQAGAEKIAFVTVPTYLPDAPLRPSGLIGPVRLVGQASP